MASRIVLNWELGNDCNLRLRELHTYSGTIMTALVVEVSERYDHPFFPIQSNDLSTALQPVLL